MAIRPLNLAAYILIVAAVVLGVYAWFLMGQEPEPEPFRSTLVISDTWTDPESVGTTNVLIWVAVANGEPKPRWSNVEQVLESPEGNRTLAPPQLEVDDQDGNGRVTEGDLIRVYELTSTEMMGTLTLRMDGTTIGTVKL
jgi:hypothetical protein